MFTMKFEIDPVSDVGGITSQVVSAARYRVRELAETCEVTMGFDDHTESPFVIGHGIGDYQRCYVMNEAGATVHTIRAPRPRTQAAA